MTYELSKFLLRFSMVNKFLSLRWHCPRFLIGIAVLAFLIALTEKIPGNKLLREEGFVLIQKNKSERVQFNTVGKAWGKSWACWSHWKCNPETESRQEVEPSYRPSRPAHSNPLPPVMHHFLKLLQQKSTTCWETSVKHMKSMGVAGILIGINSKNPETK